VVLDPQWILAEQVLGKLVHGRAPLDDRLTPPH